MRRLLSALVLAGALSAHAAPLLACAEFVSCGPSHPCSGTLQGVIGVGEVPLYILVYGRFVRVGTCAVQACLYLLSDDGTTVTLLDTDIECTLD